MELPFNTRGPDRRSSFMALEDRRGQAYSEPAFRYLLDIERKRSRRAGRTFLLLAVAITHARGSLDPLLASQLFSRLWLCLRESDYLGWLRDRRIIGAVLTRPSDRAVQELSDVIRRRVKDMLVPGLPPHVTNGLRVHVWEMPYASKNGLPTDENRTVDRPRT